MTKVYQKKAKKSTICKGIPHCQLYIKSVFMTSSAAVPSIPDDGVRDCRQRKSQITRIRSFRFLLIRPMF